MSYDASEYSVQDGDPEYRFLFVTGAAEFRYTSAAHIVADSSETWEPAPIDLGGIMQTNELSKGGVKMKLPRDNALAKTFIGGVPEQMTSVTVFRQHAGDVTEEYQVYWKGRVAGVDVSGDAVTLECENIFTSMRRPGLRARYQKTCRHALYQSGCGLDKASFAVPATVIAADGASITIEDLGSSAVEEGYFIGGMIESADGYLRYILRHSGNELTLIRPLTALIDEVTTSSDGSAAVTLYPGCDKSETTCTAKFNNLDNHGGFRIPGKNPFANSVTGSIA